MQHPLQSVTQKRKIGNRMSFFLSSLLLYLKLLRKPLIDDSSNPKKNPNPTLQAPPQQPRRTARLRTNKNAKKGPALVSVDVEDFFDIPLQYAEGRDILTLISAPQVPIPPHLMAPQQPLPPSKEIGQSSKAKPTNNPAQRPSARSTQLDGHRPALDTTQAQQLRASPVQQAQPPLAPSGLPSTTNLHDSQSATSDIPTTRLTKLHPNCSRPPRSLSMWAYHPLMTLLIWDLMMKRTLTSIGLTIMEKMT